MFKKVIRVVLVIISIFGVASIIGYRGIYGPPQITIVNNSSSELTAVVLSGERWSQSVSNISMGNSVTVLVHPKGESGLSISFVSSGQ